MVHSATVRWIHSAAIVGVTAFGGRAWAQQPAHVHGDSTKMAMSTGVENPLGIPMARMGSGTTWLPDSTPMHAHHMALGAWELMLHGDAFVQYDRQTGDRGSDQFGSINWGMLMAARQVGSGTLTLRSMMSLEPFTVGSKGYPLLLQTGETYQDQPLHDRQHPHDLFMELATLYERALTHDVGMSLYLAPVGEPASGPVAFPHRVSAMNDPLAPIGHHWQDATHISFGVITAGVFSHSVKLEGSIFNGREPDEIRTNFDYKGARLDSYAGRVLWNPSGSWSLSGSFAYLKDPEFRAPGVSIHRVTTAIQNSRRIGSSRIATTAVFGANRESVGKRTEPSYLIESNLDLTERHTVFARAEYVEKSREDLVLPGNVSGEFFNVGAVAGGYAYTLPSTSGFRTSIGVRGALNFVPEALRPVYGSRAPTGVSIFFRLGPQQMSMDHMNGMAGMRMDAAGGR